MPTALHDLLVDDGVEYAVVEVEALAWSHPPPNDEQAFRHLRDLSTGRRVQSSESHAILTAARLLVKSRDM